jgi:proteasome lid subunit RPN8/RPN11
MTDKKFQIDCSDALMEKIEAHCFSRVDVEVGGFLVGKVEEGKSIVTHVLIAKNTAAQSAQLTFTNKTWETAWAEMSEIGKDAKLIGWFHSHPNFGVFLSDYDKFIQNEFFKEDGMITIVVDPIQGKKGWFVSVNKDVRTHSPIVDTTREKLGEIKGKGKEDDGKNLELKTAASSPASGASTGRMIAIAAIFSLFTLLMNYAISGLGNIDQKSQIELLQKQVTILAAQIGMSAPEPVESIAPTETGSPAPKPTKVATSPKAQTTIADGVPCVKGSKSKTQNGQYFVCQLVSNKWVWTKAKTGQSNSTGTGSDTKSSTTNTKSNSTSDKKKSDTSTATSNQTNTDPKQGG